RSIEIEETKTEIGKYVSLDCEFVGVGHDGKRSVLARVSIVNFYGAVVLDEFVKPEEKVTDWRTWVSGIRPSDMQNAKPFKEVQFKVGEILKDRILVGHAIKNDLKVLLISHPKRMIRDTSRHPEFRKLAKGRSPALKKLAKEFLGIEIQGEEHSSVEDARACILLFRKYKDDFERLAQSK
ncbi:ribonuclease H-like domain-containing protein, partial [Lipomyces arxii]|uniref:ribonuclease H-like domain-containing protein n=1 Tax=Lipomyces arxii TaxID=56418 RepID=UPI0034CDFC82